MQFSIFIASAFMASMVAATPLQSGSKAKIGGSQLNALFPRYYQCTCEGAFADCDNNNAAGCANGDCTCCCNDLAGETLPTANLPPTAE